MGDKLQLLVQSSVMHDFFDSSSGWAKDGAFYGYYGYAAFEKVRGAFMTLCAPGAECVRS